MKSYVHVYHTSLSSSYSEKWFIQSYVKQQNTRFLLNKIFPKIVQFMRKVVFTLFTGH
jgi:hypothetical protein